MKLYILGHAQAGKDTVAAMVSRRTNLRVCSSSWYMAERVVWPKLSGEYGSVAECFADRRNRRATWYRMINEYNGDDPARLSREIFEKFDVYIGIRNIEELRASRHEGLPDAAIWVDASKRVDPESTSSMTITKEDCDLVLDNNGTEQELKTRVEAMCRIINLTPNRGTTVSRGLLKTSVVDCYCGSL